MTIELPKNTPPHPGEILKEIYMVRAGVETQTHLAALIHCDLKSINRVIKGRAAISNEMAIKLGTLFGTGPYLWATMQQKYDLWQLTYGENALDCSEVQSLAAL